MHFRKRYAEIRIHVKHVRALRLLGDEACPQRRVDALLRDLGVGAFVPGYVKSGQPLLGRPHVVGDHRNGVGVVVHQ